MKTDNFRDYYLRDEGSLVLFGALTEAGQKWLKEHAPKDADHNYIGSLLAVEPRYLADFIAHAREDGLSGPAA